MVDKQTTNHDLADVLLKLSQVSKRLATRLKTLPNQKGEQHHGKHNTNQSDSTSVRPTYW